MKIVSELLVKESATDIKLSSPEKCAEQLTDLCELAQECFVVLTLNTKNKLIKRHVIGLGSINCTLVHPREVFRVAIKDAAYAIIIAHNHPSGDCKPSSEDIIFTKSLVEGGKLLKIPVLDHIIVGNLHAEGKTATFNSLRETGLVNFI